MSTPWATPDASVAQPRPAPTEVPPEQPASVPSRRDDRPPLPPPPLPLRPMTIPDLLDGSFAIVKRRPRDVFVLAVAFVVPVEVLSAVLLRDVVGADLFGGVTDPGSTSSAETTDPFEGLDATLITIGFGAISLALLAGAMAHMVRTWYDGEDVPAGALLLHTLRRSPALLVGVVAVHALELVGLLGLVIGAYFVMAFLHVVSPAIVAEDIGPFRAIGRSMRLTSGRLGASLTVPALVGLIGALVGFGFQLLPELATLLVPDDWAWLVRAVGQTLAQLVVVPFTAGVAVLYHLDLRIRSEALDIERRAHAVFGG